MAAMIRFGLLVCLVSSAAAEPTHISIGERTLMVRTQLPDGRVFALDTDGTATVADRPIRSLDVARWWSVATPLPDGRVLVTGGSPATFSNELDTFAETYDPKADRWSPIGPFAIGRIGHTATVLADGRVLLVGGMSGALLDRHAVANAELYEPDRSVTPTTPHDARAGHAAVVLADGRVLVAGGYDAHGELLASAELYDPAHDRWTRIAAPRTYRKPALAVLGDGRVLALTTVPEPTIVEVGKQARDSIDGDLYDPATSTWHAIAHLGGAGGSEITLARAGDRIVRCARVLVGGRDPSVWPRECHVYDPATDRWSKR
jgi:hypothetical protein